LSDFEAGRKNVRLAPLVLLRASLGRARENCAVDRAVQTRHASWQETCVPRLEGIARATARGAGNGGEGIEASYCDAVFAHERYSLHLTRRRRNHRTCPVIRSRASHKRGTLTKIRGRVFPGSAPDACG